MSHLLDSWRSLATSSDLGFAWYLAVLFGGALYGISRQLARKGLERASKVTEASALVVIGIAVAVWFLLMVPFYAD